MSGTTSRRLLWAFLGRVPYREAVDLQLRLREALGRRQAPEHLLFLEHPHVYTLGRNATREDLLAEETWLEERGVEVCMSDRGGQVTYHGPGQLVGYPILDLNPDRRDIRRYVRDLQAVLVGTLAELGIEARGGEEQDFIGVWVGERKIASIGVHLRRWRTTHGFALNVTTDLSYFSGIVACGLPGLETTSIERLTGARLQLPDVAQRCARQFARVFQRDLAPMDTRDLGAAWATPS